jgi:hypothetical protein
MKILKSTIIISSCILLSCNKNRGNVYYYIPEGVNKPFAIIYDNKVDVNSNRDKKGQLVYVIPQNRILYVKDGEEPNISTSNIYYIDKNGDTIKRVRNYYYDTYKKIPIKRGEIYELNSYYKVFNKSNKESLRMQIIILGNDFTEKGQEDAIKSAVNLENYIYEHYR